MSRRYGATYGAASGTDFFLDNDAADMVVDPSFLIDPDMLGGSGHGGDDNYGRVDDDGEGGSPKHPIFDIRSASPYHDRRQQQQQRTASLSPARHFQRQGGDAMDNRSFLLDGTLGSGPASLHGSPAKRRTLALKEQENTINELKKENFSLKLKIFFLEERMTKMAPENVKDAYKENVELKVESETLRAEVSNYKKLLVESHHAIDALRDGGAASGDGSFRHELHANKKILADQAVDLERLRHEHRENLNSLSAAKHKIRELEEYIELSAKTSTSHNSHTALEDTVIQYRKEIERLEQELSKTKTQLFTVNSNLAQRSIELEQIRGAHESLQIQVGDLTGNAEFSTGTGSDNGTSLMETRQLHNQQMEQGIAMLRDQISELKLQLIEKNANCDHLRLEIEAKTQAHARAIEQLENNAHKEELKMKSLVTELREQLSHSRAEVKNMSVDIERTQHGQRLTETNLQIELQNYKHQVSLKEQTVSTISQERDKLKSELKVMENNLRIKTNTLENLSKQVEAKSKLLYESEQSQQQSHSQLQTRIASLTSQISERTLELQAKDSEIRHLQDQIERQSSQLILIEERWAKQTQDITQQQKAVREELEQQIQNFKVRMDETNQALQKKKSEAEELRSQLNMHSIGMDEAIKLHVHEKERAKQDMLAAYRDLEKLKLEMARLHSQLEETSAAYKDSVVVAERMSEELKLRDMKLDKQDKERLDMEETIRAKERDIRDKLQVISNLRQRITNSDQVLAEGQSVVETMDKSYRNKLEERNELLVKIQTSIDALLNEEQRLTVNLNMGKPDDNFFAFADTLLEKINLVSKVIARFEHKIKSTETYMGEEFKLLNKKLDRKMVQLEKFESIIRQVAEVQRDLRSAVKTKQQELQGAKITITTLEHELAVQKHRITTVQSSSAITATSDKAKFLDAQAKITELERLLKVREHKARDEQARIKELEEHLHQDKLGSQKRVQELSDDLRLLRREMEASRTKNQQLELLISAYKKSLEEAASNAGAAHQVTRLGHDHRLRDMSDSAMHTLNARLREELDAQRASFERERQRYLEREEEYTRLKSDYRKVKRRLAKREAMIDIALSKLELVNNRKDAAEMTLLHKFSDDMRSMMRAADSMPSMDQLNISPSFLMTQSSSAYTGAGASTLVHGGSLVTAAAAPALSRANRRPSAPSAPSSPSATSAVRERFSEATLRRVAGGTETARDSAME